jgi:phosphonate transport system ATP-binding protein
MTLTLEKASVRHDSGSTRGRDGLALHDLDLTVRDGEQIAVIGPSGAGKTTLLQLLACAQRPATGVFELDGTAPWSLSTRALQRLRATLFLAPQVPPLPPRQRVVTAVLAGRLPTMGAWASVASLFRPSDIPAAHAALARFDLADKLFERVDRLSGGERQRVGLARALVAPARLWLVDEPLSSLDPTRADQALAALTDSARERGVTLITSLHQVDAALAAFPRIVGLRDGRIAFDLPAAEVGRDHLARLYAQDGGAPVASPTAEPGMRQEPARTTAMPCR